MREMNISSPVVAVKDLIWQGVAITPHDGSQRAAREAAYYRMKRWGMGRMKAFFDEMAQDALIDLADDTEMDGGTPGAPIDPTNPFPG